MKYSRKYILTTLRNEIRNITGKEYLVVCDLARLLQDNEKLMKIWRKSEDFHAFIRSLRGSQDEDILYNNFTVYWFGTIKPDWYYRREFCGRYASCFFKTQSEGGSLKIGSTDMEVLVSNHYGDDTNRVAVFDSLDFDYRLSMLFPYSDVTVKGSSVKVFSKDWSDEVACELSPGMWHVYSDDRFFALVKWSD